jgi:hypothetical protein
MFALHCGHCIFGGPLRWFFGDSRSATQSSRHASCAVRAHGQGDRQSEDVGSSSVSSEKHIQHFRGSLFDGAVWGFGLGDPCRCLFSNLGEHSDEDG